MFVTLFLLSLIPIAHMVYNAEDNFKKAQIKKIASKRIDRLDREHGIDRDQITDDYEKLDEAFRITEKEEIKKYLQIGKTPEQYYQDKARRAARAPRDEQDPQEKPSIQRLKENLIKSEFDGMQISEIQGENFEQLKFSQDDSKSPDPRIGGASVIFDTRLDAPKNEPSPALLRKLAQRSQQQPATFEPK